MFLWPSFSCKMCKMLITFIFKLYMLHKSQYVLTILTGDAVKMFIYLCIHLYAPSSHHTSQELTKITMSVIIFANQSWSNYCVFIETSKVKCLSWPFMPPNNQPASWICWTVKGKKKVFLFFLSHTPQTWHWMIAETKKLCYNNK